MMHVRDDFRRLMDGTLPDPRKPVPVSPLRGRPWEEARDALVGTLSAKGHRFDVYEITSTVAAYRCCRCGGALLIGIDSEGKFDGCYKSVFLRGPRCLGKKEDVMSHGPTNTDFAKAAEDLAKAVARVRNDLLATLWRLRHAMDEVRDAVGPSMSHSPFVEPKSRLQRDLWHYQDDVGELAGNLHSLVNQADVLAGVACEDCGGTVCVCSVEEGED